MADKKPEYRIIRRTRDGQWEMLEVEGHYVFVRYENDEPSIVNTPAGNMVQTIYPDLAERILNDLDRFGYDFHSPESILAWHFTMIDNFSEMDHARVEAVLDQSFLQHTDWTFDENQGIDKWKYLFGEEKERKEKIREWLSKCTHMQMTAACCIGSAYHSINMSYVLAWLMENFKGNKLKQKFAKLAELIAENSPYGPAEDIVGDFATFELYYGIHLYEKGFLINENMLDENEADIYIGKEISTEALVGRNFYLYTGWRKADSQPAQLDLVDLDLDLDDEEEDEDEEYIDDFENGDNELQDYIPENCWIKRFSALEDGCEAYHILAISTDNSGKIEAISVVQETVQRMGGGFFMIPGMELQGYSSYDELDYIPENIFKELDMLVRGRYLKKDFSFIGKKIPQKMIDKGGNGGSNTEYVYALQSAYRLAYMHMTIDTDEDGTIDDFNYSSYQSSGSSYGDMFSRPMLYSDRTDEAIDMLLYLLDLYTEEEYQSFDSQ